MFLKGAMHPKETTISKNETKQTVVLKPNEYVLEGMKLFPCVCL